MMNIMIIMKLLMSTTDQDFLKIIEFLNAEIRILKTINKEHREMNDEERFTLSTLAQGIKKALRLGTLETIFKPKTILGWLKRFENRKFDGSKSRKGKGRPSISEVIRNLVITLALANKSWGADRIAGQMHNLNYEISDQTVLNILKENNIPIAPIRKLNTTWKEFLKAHWDQIWGIDFFQKGVWTFSGIKIVKVFVAIQYCTRKIKVLGIIENPNEEWMMQQARNITDVYEPMLENCKHLVHDGDPLYTPKFISYLNPEINTIKILPNSPNMNPFAERVIRSIREDCLNHLAIVGEGSLRKIMKEYVDHYHFERNHQGIGNQIIESENEILQHSKKGKGEILCQERVGGLLIYYYRNKVA
ncbi:MAG: hypothetical protein COA79_13910 [Planctomycetota bacterium]|nr:MAG: hypothetical protein COA79_13910 [Planctomycetota bacterium]